MSMVVGPAGFSGEESLPAPTRGYLGCYRAPATEADSPGEPAATGSGHRATEAGDQLSPETAMMDRFLDDYLRLMSGRLDLIQHYVDGIRYEEARVAILSLESASGMVGESTLRSLLHDLRLCVDVCTTEQQHERLAAIRVEAATVHERLSESR